MSEKYFEKFQTITYANTQAKDLTQRVIFTENALKNPYVFYPYELSYFERPDQFAHRYYGDQYYAWLIYMTNNITDPYYEWYMPDYEFKSFIQKKYGSVEAAQTKIKFYRHDWENADPITISEFNALPPTLIHYWEPQYGVGSNIISYARRKEEIVYNTNKIRSYSVPNTANFLHDEKIMIDFDRDHIGYGQVMSTAKGTKTITVREYQYLPTNRQPYWEPIIDNNRVMGYIQKQTVHIQHVSGISMPSNTVSIISSSMLCGEESETEAVFTTADIAAENLHPEEEKYFIPITYWEYENEKNEANKTIQVLDTPYAKTIAKDLKDLLK